MPLKNLLNLTFRHEIGGLGTSTDVIILTVDWWEIFHSEFKGYYYDLPPQQNLTCPVRMLHSLLPSNCKLNIDFM
jgi:hypothetical protein